jgi:hypothetical protein
MAAARFLAARGAAVTANDARGEPDLAAERSTLESLGATVALGGHPEPLFRAADLVVVSPGVPLALAPFEAARRAGVEIVSEIELASRYLEGTINRRHGEQRSTTLARRRHSSRRQFGTPPRGIGVPFIGWHRWTVGCFLCARGLVPPARCGAGLPPEGPVLTRVVRSHGPYDRCLSYVAAKAPLRRTGTGRSRRAERARRRRRRCVRPRVHPRAARRGRRRAGDGRRG